MEHLGTISTLGEEAQDKGWGTSRTLPDLSVIGFSEFNATSECSPRMPWDSQVVGRGMDRLLIGNCNPQCSMKISGNVPERFRLFQ